MFWYFYLLFPKLKEKGDDWTTSESSRIIGAKTMTSEHWDCCCCIVDNGNTSPLLVWDELWRYVYNADNVLSTVAMVAKLSFLPLPGARSSIKGLFPLSIHSILYFLELFRKTTSNRGAECKCRPHPVYDIKVGFIVWYDVWYVWSTSFCC